MFRKNIVRMVSEYDSTKIEDINIERQTHFLGLSLGHEDDQLPEESVVIRRSIPDIEDNAAKTTILRYYVSKWFSNHPN